MSPSIPLGPLGLADLGALPTRRVLALALHTSPVLTRGLALTALLALVAGASRIIAPLTIQHSLDAGLTQASVARAVVVGGMATVVAGVCSWALTRRLWFAIEEAVADLRRRGLVRVHDMSPATADRVPSADLVARLTSDLDAVTTFLQGGGLQMVTNLAQLAISGTVLALYSWQLALPVFATALALLAAMSLIQRAISQRFDAVRRSLSRMQVTITEAVVGAPVIHQTGTEERMRRKLDAAVDEARDSLLRTQAPLHGNASSGELAISTMTIAVLLGGTWWALQGGGAPRLSAGQVVAMVFLVTFFVRPLQMLVTSLGESQNALTGWRRALELVATPSAEVTGGSALPPGPVRVTLVGVEAAYGTGPRVLHGVTVDLAAGQHVAVVGRTGSGKSTFAKLLTRRIEPVAGEIRLAGVPLHHLDDASLAGRVVIVPQDPFLFEGTLGDNIALGAPGATGADVERVLHELGLARWLADLPDGLATPVGLRGDRLSVGERQLVALARTALIDPDLVVLDEATSGVDPATDVAVQAALAVLTRGRTTVSIAHRMSTAEAADRVLVFQDGRIVQDGHHRDLMHRPGPYAALFAAWRARPGAAR